MSASVSSAVVELLRVNPQSTMERYRFVVEPEVYTIGKTGGPCTVTCTQLNDNIYRLGVTATSGGDWYYPYITFGDSVGICDVPVGQPDGTIVLTGGMNGCSTVVTRRENNMFRFHHDKNSCSIAKLPAESMKGDIVCRIGFADYAGEPTGAYQLQLTTQLSHPRKFVTLYEHYIIAVKHEGKWLMMNSAVLRSQGMDPQNSKTIFMGYDPPDASQLITSFDDI
ncbi:hypothetical protein [Acidocella sp.]|uniref:hypothetical protein n=1 Tax=Acidocella sp. TaxID=50710 RepID=UPI003D031F1E